jgi:hypothetical protein
MQEIVANNADMSQTYEKNGLTFLRFNQLKIFQTCSAVEIVIKYNQNYLYT